MTQTFASDAQSGAAAYPGNGTSTQPTGRTNLTITYDATTRSYTIDSALGMIAFATQDRNAAASNSRETVYTKNNGTITNTLALTNAGNSGPFNYRYVGAGIQRQTDTAGGIEQNRFNAFTYGIRAPDSAVPLTGSGSFSVGITGLAAQNSGIFRFDGTGLLTVDFATRNITGSGRITARLPNSSGYFSLFPGDFTASGVLASGANFFMGTIDLNSLTRYTAALDGRFYGPNLEEVGGSFSGRNAQNQAVIGALIGRAGNVVLPYEDLTTLFSPVSLQYIGSNITFTPSTGGSGFGNAAIGGQGFGGEFKINPSPLSYSYFETLDPSNLLAVQPDARFTAYKPTPEATFRIYKNGASNSELQLSYASFGVREFRANSSPFRDEFFAFGMATNSQYLPRTGTGSYEGVLHGSAVGSGNNADRFSLSGSANFDFNFGQGSFSGALVPTATNLRDSSITNLGTYTFINAFAPGFAGMSSAFFADIAGPAGTSGRMDGRFYGPDGQELGGVFTLITPGAGTILTGTGAVVAKRK